MEKENNSFSTYSTIERDNEKESFRNCRTQLLLYKKAFNLLIDNLDYVLDASGQELPSVTQISSMLIIYRMIGSMQSIRVLVLRGYYYESSILFRNFYESLALCAYLKSNPRQTENWLQGKEITVLRKGKEAPISKRLLLREIKKIFMADDTPIDLMSDAMYKYLSGYVHSGFFANLKGAGVRFEQETKIIGGQPAGNMILQIPQDFNKKEVEGLPFLPISLLYALLYFFDNLPNERKVAILLFLKLAINRLNNEK